MKRRIFQGFICLQLLAIGGLTNAAEETTVPLWKQESDARLAKFREDNEWRRAKARGEVDVLSTQTAVEVYLTTGTRQPATTVTVQGRQEYFAGRIGPVYCVRTTETLRNTVTGETRGVEYTRGFRILQE